MSDPIDALKRTLDIHADPIRQRLQGDDLAHYDAAIRGGRGVILLGRGSMLLGAALRNVTVILSDGVTPHMPAAIQQRPAVDRCWPPADLATYPQMAD